nr:putative ATPase subunit 9 [Picea sitchensis]QHR88426.1 putative ATPase subunit 9 [Picea sitchensis]
MKGTRGKNKPNIIGEAKSEEKDPIPYTMGGEGEKRTDKTETFSICWIKRCEINRCWSSYNCSIALAGAAAGIGNALSSLIHSVARNPF